MKISVVIATYNRPDLLLKCLDALANQKLNKDEFEVVVVSDGPDQKTRYAVDNWMKRNEINLRFYSLPHKKGPATARNFGWLNASGELIAFTDDDCLPDENWLNAFVNSYHPEKNEVFTGKTIVPIPTRPTDYELNTANLQSADFITANCCCPKRTLEKVGGFDERFTMAWREDSDLEFKLINEDVTIVKVNDAVVVHPVRKAIWGISIKEQKKTMFNALLFKKFPDLYRKKIQQKPPFNYYAMIVAFMMILLGLALISTPIILVALTFWSVLITIFIYKRLSATSLSVNHVFEMVITSAVIPFLSIFWQIYGAIKYRVLFF